MPPTGSPDGGSSRVRFSSPLETLDLRPGDVVHFRAVARDRNDSRGRGGGLLPPASSGWPVRMRPPGHLPRGAPPWRWNGIRAEPADDPPPHPAPSDRHGGRGSPGIPSLPRSVAIAGETATPPGTGGGTGLCPGHRGHAGAHPPPGIPGGGGGSGVGPGPTSRFRSPSSGPPSPTAWRSSSGSVSDGSYRPMGAPRRPVGHGGGALRDPGSFPRGPVPGGTPTTHPPSSR